VLSYNGFFATSLLTFQNEVQTLTLLANGATRLNFNGTDATSDLNVTLGTTNAGSILSNLQTIPALSAAGNVTVTQSTSDPKAFTITFGGALAGQDVAQITSSNTVTAVSGVVTNGSAPTAAQVQTNLNSIFVPTGSVGLNGNVQVTGGPSAATP